MKQLHILFFISSCLFQNSQAQNKLAIEGGWSGVFITSDSSYWDDIKVVFEPNSDKTYSARSYTKLISNIGKDTLLVCKMDCRVIKHDSLVITEIEVLEPVGVTPEICFQTFELKFISSAPHRPRQLVGKWYCYPRKDQGSGFVRLKKRTD